MTGDEDPRTVLRRRIFDAKDMLVAIMDDAGSSEPQLQQPLSTARNALFEAWTVLATPLAEEEDH